MFHSESELETNYESASEASCELMFEAEPDAVDDHMYTPFESDSEPAPMSMALNIEAESPPLQTGQANVSFHHSASPVSSQDQNIGQVQHAQQEEEDAAGAGGICSSSKQHVSGVDLKAEDQPFHLGQPFLSCHHSASPVSSENQNTGQLQRTQQEQDAAGENVACNNYGQHIGAVSSSDALSDASGSECKQEAAQQASAVGTAEHSKQSCLSGFISSFKKIKGSRSRAESAVVSPRAAAVATAAGGAAVTGNSFPDSKSLNSGKLQPAQKLKRLVNKLRPKCMREADTHSHQQAENVEPSPAAAAASQASGAQQARRPQSWNKSNVVSESQQPLPAAAGSRDVQPAKTPFKALVRDKFTKGRQTSRQVQHVAAHVDIRAVCEQQQQQQQPTPDKAGGNKQRLSKLVGLFKHKETASKAALTSLVSLSSQSTHDAAPADLIPAVMQPSGVAQQADPPAVTTTAEPATQPAHQVSTMRIACCQ